VNSLNTSKLTAFFPNHSKVHLKTFILFLTCALRCKTANIYKCKDHVKNISKNKQCSTNSHYVKFIRFFKIKNIAEFIIGIQRVLFVISKPDLTYLIVDRTNWKFGAKNINLLTIGCLDEGVFSPLLWKQLDKRGNSNLEDRSFLIDSLLSMFSVFKKAYEGSILLADREFIGKEWFEYLTTKKLSFVIRLREKLYFDLQTYTGKKKVSLKYFSKYIEKYGIYSVPLTLGECTYTVVMIKNIKHDPNEPYLYFISDLKDAKAIAAHYFKRWKIECAFKHLKSNGFNIEDIALKGDEKIELMMAILCLLYRLAINEGIILNKKVPIKFKIYKNGTTYLSVSIFRTGLTIIQHKLNNMNLLIKYLYKELEAFLLKDCEDFNYLNV